MGDAEGLVSQLYEDTAMQYHWETTSISSCLNIIYLKKTTLLYIFTGKQVLKCDQTNHVTCIQYCTRVHCTVYSSLQGIIIILSCVGGNYGLQNVIKDIMDNFEEKLFSLIPLKRTITYSRKIMNNIVIYISNTV